MFTYITDFKTKIFITFTRTDPYYEVDSVLKNWRNSINVMCIQLVLVLKEISSQWLSHLCDGVGQRFVLEAT